MSNGSTTIDFSDAADEAAGAVGDAVVDGEGEVDGHRHGELEAADVTAGGVKAVRSTVKSANWNHQYVSKAVNAASPPASGIGRS